MRKSIPLFTAISSNVTAGAPAACGCAPLGAVGVASGATSGSSPPQPASRAASGSATQTAEFGRDTEPPVDQSWTWKGSSPDGRSMPRNAAA